MDSLDSFLSYAPQLSRANPFYLVHLASPHSSIFDWTIPWTEELGGLQSMGLEESDMI